MTDGVSECMKPLKLGFVALSDAAPLVVAKRLGLYQQAGLNVELCRQPSWSTLRDKLIFGELQAAQLLSPMALSIHLGLGGGVKKPMVAASVLNRGGNALMVSYALYDKLMGSVGQLDEPAKVVDYLSHLEQPLRVGTVFPFSMHSLQLRLWFKRLGIAAEAIARFEVVPPARMVKALKEGQLDVCCVGEPYGTLAEFENVGHVIAHSGEFWPNWPEKVLGLTQAGAQELGSDLPGLTDAVEKACQWLEASPENRQQAAVWMADAEVLNLPVQVIEKSLLNQAGLSFKFGASDETRILQAWLPEFTAQVLELEQHWFAPAERRDLSIQDGPFSGCGA